MEFFPYGSIIMFFLGLLCLWPNSENFWRRLALSRTGALGFLLLLILSGFWSLGFKGGVFYPGGFLALIPGIYIWNKAVDLSRRRILVLMTFIFTLLIMSLAFLGENYWYQIWLDWYWAGAIFLGMVAALFVNQMAEGVSLLLIAWPCGQFLAYIGGSLLWGAAAWGGERLTDGIFLSLVAGVATDWLLRRKIYLNNTENKTRIFPDEGKNAVKN